MKTNKTSTKDALNKQKPAESPEEREKQMISYAENLAEIQLREGTASSQVITHYLKLATSRERLEREKLELEKQLLSAKTEALQASKKMEETYAKVLEVMSLYSGRPMNEDL